MNSSGEEARPVIRQWSESGTSLDLSLRSGLGIGMRISDVRVQVVDAPSGDSLRVTSSTSDFEFVVVLREWKMSLALEELSCARFDSQEAPLTFLLCLAR